MLADLTPSNMPNDTGHPWNKDRAVGQKRPFTQDQIRQLANLLKDAERQRELTLFCLGIDTMLRSSDLVRLRVRDLIDQNGQPKPDFSSSQQKTGAAVVSVITPFSQAALRTWIEVGNLSRRDYLFTSRSGDGSKPITTNFLRRLVKKWAAELGLDPTDYSGHSLRRSKPSHLYAQGVRPEMLRLLLGHKSLQSTQAYLGIDQNEALALARKFDCFKEF
ncbi:tyrosine-type recombinase/integrase [Cohaesibacter gelatinilyticus]|uniref:Phage integrase family protein n=1 Tax=Cohaesibacter gelatinilyticus TaxID=372072 RepID=A0A285PE86_9HYPH|nr:tyrosine-type recombinase/integrase [Cohaesibacter gelatinilyticus]SNZ20070.1 Phage integrase family protein [Cohaesibacter gelatinilyticus]